MPDTVVAPLINMARQETKTSHGRFPPPSLAQTHLPFPLALTLELPARWFLPPLSPHVPTVQSLPPPLRTATTTKTLHVLRFLHGR